MALAHLWMTDTAFIEAWLSVKDITLCSIDRCYVLWQLARQANHVAEVGVYKGGTAFILQQASSGQTFLYDTFEGVPRSKGPVPAGTYAVSASSVLNRLSRSRTTIFRGRIEAKGVRAPSYTLDVVHVDCDTGEGTAAAVKKLWPALRPGGVMVVDDYGINLEPVTHAVDNFLATGRVLTLQAAYAQIVMVRR